MATGDAADIRSRLRSILPAGWFQSASDGSPSPTPILDTVLAGIADSLAWAWSLVTYAQSQMRLPTSTDGWLDIAALDYFGPDGLPRADGESDAAYAARIEANLLPRSATRQVISDVVEAVTQETPRIIEPWRPQDTGVWDGIQTTTRHWDDNISWDDPNLTWDEGLQTVGAFYWDVDTKETPFRWVGNERFTSFIDTKIPTTTVLGGAQIAFLDSGTFNWDVAGSSFMDLPGLLPGEELVLDAITKAKAEGVQIGIRFNQPSLVQPITAPISAFDGGFFYWDTGEAFWAGVKAIGDTSPTVTAPFIAGPISAFDGGYFYFDTGYSFWTGAYNEFFILDASVLGGSDTLGSVDPNQLLADDGTPLTTDSGGPLQPG